MTIARTTNGLLFSDDFNRANGAPGANYTIDLGTWAISGNKLVSTTGAGQAQIRLTGLAARKDAHIQLSIIKNHLSDYAAICFRVAAAGGGNYYILDLGAATDGADPNKTRIYRATGGGFTRLGGGTAIGGAPVAGVAYRENFTVKTGEQKLWINGTAGGATADATVANDIVGFLLISYVPQGGSANIQIDDIIVCSDRSVSCTGLPAGAKIVVNGLTSGAAVAGTATLDLQGTQLPAPNIQVIDSVGNPIETLVASVYGGDVYAFTFSPPLVATAGGASGVIVGAIENIGTLAVAAGGASASGEFGHFEDNPYPLGRREAQADFVGHRTGNVSITKRPDAISFDYLTSFSMGPRAFGDISTGATDRPWRVRADNALKQVFLAKTDDTGTAWMAETLLFSFAGVDIEEIDLAFDQSGNALVCMERNSGAGGAKEVWLYWFKPTAGMFVLEMLEAGRTPRILLDNPPDPTNSDVILFYLKTGVGLVYRVQREVYAVVHATPHIIEPDWYVEDAFYTKGYRVAVFLSHHSGKTYGKKRLETTLMPVFIQHEDLKMFGWAVNGTLVRTLIIFTDDPAYAGNAAGPMLQEYFTMGGTLGGANTLAGNVIFHTLYDIPALQFGGGLSDDGALTDPGITFLTHDLYDIEEFTLGAGVALGTLAGSVIFHDLYDKDSFKMGASFGAGGTLA